MRVHDAPAAMRFALVPLAIGALTTWLLAGPLAQLMETSLPFHTLPEMSTSEMIGEVIGAPATWVALAVVAAGLAAWRWRTRNAQAAARLSARFQGFTRVAAADFGFERINSSIVRTTLRLASSLRTSQTGQLNWNVVGIVGGLILVLAILAWGA